MRRQLGCLRARDLAGGRLGALKKLGWGGGGMLSLSMDYVIR